jgi:type III pantothenate kinase
MILTVNIGNTHITVGGYEQDTLIFCGRLHSDPAATVEEYAIRLVNLLQLYGASPAQIEGGILGSVVPMLSGRVLAALQLLCKARILTVGPGLKSGIKLRLDNPAQLGAELLCGAVAALAECSGPLVVISADTAISLMAVNAKQELVGGVILPGPQLSMNALVQKTAQLPQIDPAARAPDSVLGKSTSACLQNGFVLGTASLLDGLADRYRFYVENRADRTVVDAAYAACWRRYLFLCAKVRQAPTPELVKAISKEQFLMQGLISYLPNCRNMKMTEKLSAARWAMMSAQSLCPIK